MYVHSSIYAVLSQASLGNPGQGKATLDQLSMNKINTTNTAHSFVVDFVPPASPTTADLPIKE